MTTETIETLAQLGINPTVKHLSLPATLEMNLDLTIQRMGTSIILFCKGGEPVYDTLANHGAVCNDHEVLFAGYDTPYLTLSPERAFDVFKSVITMRILCTGNKQDIRRHQKIANETAKQWLELVPREQNPIYARHVALNDC